VSVIAHGVILFRVPGLDIFWTKNQEDASEVVYVKEVPRPKDNLRIITRKKEPFLKLSEKITADRRVPPPYIDKESLFKGNKTVSSQNANIAKPSFVNPDVIAIKKSITLPPLDLDKMNNSSYISYYQIVREKIKRAAYQNYIRQDTGEAYITFIISSDGSLKETRLVEEKSTSQQYLRDIALKSVKDSAPFPSFPQELNYPSLTFNVIISFELE
jgi:outer membrane biosynthesis protein TonB